ncbi:MAG: DUF1853 family protein [Reinekea sp.]
MNEYLPWPAIHSDVEWILNAPSLLTRSEELWQMPVPENIDYSIIWQNLETITSRRSGKLGLYFETLVHAMFMAHPRFELLANNIIIRHNGRTLGEVDLLLQDLETDEVIHLELALKFYLGLTGPGEPATRFIGAGLHDFLHRKLHRLYHHQLVLPNIAKQVNGWPDHLPFPDKHRLWIPGRLYLPEGIEFKSMAGAVPDTPWRLNPKCEVSYWITAEDKALPKGAKPLQKAAWLSGHDSPGKANIRLPAQFILPDSKLPVYVLPTGWHTQALQKIKAYQQSL